MGLFRNFGKKRAIKKYVLNLGRDLVGRYGRSDHYTSGQVARTIEACGYPKNYIHYALAIYTTQSEFDQWLDAEDVMYCYDDLFDEISNMSFRGKSKGGVSVPTSGPHDMAYRDDHY